ncbi:MAG: hypothetical protein HND57_01825 [Planctomycetes bacterium]|nr:hypothetical protein [Planctomycetota bacterium]
MKWLTMKRASQTLSLAAIALCGFGMLGFCSTGDPTAGLCMAIVVAAGLISLAMVSREG